LINDNSPNRGNSLKNARNEMNYGESDSASTILLYPFYPENRRDFAAQVIPL
jgi:hypothetical protein